MGLADFLDSDEMKKLRKKIHEATIDNINRGNVLLGQMPELKDYVISTIIEAEKKEECTYRCLIYTALNAGRWSYAPLQLAGLLTLHNMFYDNSDFLSTYKISFIGESKYNSLSEEDKISVISAAIQEFLPKDEACIV